MTRFCPILAAVMFGMAGLAPNALAAEPPPVFQRLSFAKAREKAESESRLLIVKATAEWCKPCKMMDKTTWVDEEVVAWIGAHAVAIQIDVDKQPKTARGLKVRAMPTMIAFKGEAEIDRIVGYKEAGELLEWLENVRKGKTSVDVLREEAGERAGPDGKVDVQKRLDLARALTNAGKLDEATEEYLWLWDNMLTHDRSFYGVRLSFMASEMAELAKEHPPAREKFVALRARYEEGLAENPGSVEERADWIALNEVVGETRRTLEWFDKAKDDPKQREVLDRMDHSIEELLLKEGRWADLGRSIRDPLRKIQQAYWLHGAGSAAADPGADAQQAAEMKEVRLRMWRVEVATVYAALLAAGRDDEAKKVIEQAMTSLPDVKTRVAAIGMALEAGEPRSEHIEWAEEAAKAGEATDGLIQRLREALAASPTNK